jgi:histidinol-phosphate aminotransferase
MPARKCPIQQGLFGTGLARRRQSLLAGAPGRIIRLNSVEEFSMPYAQYSRRDFSRVIGQSLAIAFTAPGLRSVHAGSPVANPAAPAQPPKILLNFNENPYGPTPKALEALSACGLAAARYPDAAYAQVRDALATMHGMKRENIVLGCGSSEILRAADLAFLGSGQDLIVAEPTFESVLKFARVTRATPIKIPLTTDHRHDLRKMAAACTSKAGIVYVCNPNNPTGTIVTRNELMDFIPSVPATALILVDEAYFHFAENPQYASVIDWIDKYPNLLVARTFSKIYGMAGMRLGYAVGSKETIAAMNTQILRDNGNAAVLAAALASLADNEHVTTCRTRMNATRRWLANELVKDGRPFIPSEANFMMIDMGMDVLPIIEQFEARNILVGRRFPSMSNFLRVTIGTQPEMEAFVATLREISPAPATRAA